MARRSRIDVAVWVAAGVMAAGALVACGSGSGDSSSSGAAPSEVAGGDATMVADVAYADTTCPVAGDDSSTVGDLYLPTEPAATPAPAVVFVHGGAFRAGGRNTSSYPAMSEELARLGWVVYNIDYCLADDSDPGFPSQVQEVSAAAKFLTSSAFAAKSGGLAVDPGKIATWGGSAGATLAVATGLALGKSVVAATVGWSGPYDFVDIGGRNPSKFVAPSIYLGCDPTSDASCASGVATEASPARNITSSTPPTILFQGDSELVPVTQIQTMTSALKSADVPVDSTTLTGDAGNRHATGYTSTAFCPTVADLQPYLGDVRGTCQAPADGKES